MKGEQCNKYNIETILVNMKLVFFVLLNKLDKR